MSRHSSNCLLVAHCLKHDLPVQGDFKAFYDSAVSNSNKLFVMIVDECHYGATRGQAHDTYVNDCDSQTG